MKRRYFLLAGATAAGAISLSRIGSRPSTANKPSFSGFEVTKTEAEWRRLLTPEQFYILRQAGTERPFSSPLDKQFAKGTYQCVGCHLPVFTSDAKFNSGTGWPSFSAPIPGATEHATSPSDLAMGTEIHCRRCGGHFGHLFDGGPPPTGHRYCIDGVALQFVPA
ncbi:MAG: peptide-methionine (R)-S-oxide reductase MsrB [Thermosynechococcaceae cyanobacterium]